jgi:hypothetical protein
MAVEAEKRGGRTLGQTQAWRKVVLESDCWEGWMGGGAVLGRVKNGVLVVAGKEGDIKLQMMC